MKHAFIIQKILNNNAVISRNEKKQEIIIMGSGIGFSRKVGDIVPREKIYKIYELRTHAFKSRFESLLEEIPFDVFMFCQTLVERATSILQEPLKDGLVLTLADHIHFAIERYHKGVYQPSIVLDEIAILYQREYQCGQQLLQMINTHFQVELPQAEVTSLAFHLVEAKLNAESKNGQLILTEMNQIIQIIECELGASIKDKQVAYARLVVHLKYFLNRVMAGEHQPNQMIDKALFNQQDEQYQKVQAIIQKIRAYLMEKFEYAMDESEEVYLLIHLTRVL